MMEIHSKLLFMGVVLRYPQDGSVEPSSKDITVFTKNLTRALERNNILPESGRLRGKRKYEPNKPSKHQMDPSVTIVCEHYGEDKNPHAHVIIMVNGNAKKDPRDIQKRASRAWEITLGVENGFGLVHHLLNRAPPTFSRQCKTHFTTIATLSVRGKEYRRKGLWMVRGTEFPKQSWNKPGDYRRQLS